MEDSSLCATMDALTSAVLFRFSDLSPPPALAANQQPGSSSYWTNKTGLVPFRKASHVPATTTGPDGALLPRCRHSLPHPSANSGSATADGEPGGRRTSDGADDLWSSPLVVRPGRHSLSNPKDVIRQARTEAAAPPSPAVVMPPPVPHHHHKPHRHSQQSIADKDGFGVVGVSACGDQAVAHAHTTTPCLAKDLSRANPDVIAKRMLASIAAHEEDVVASSADHDAEFVHRSFGSGDDRGAAAAASASASAPAGQAHALPHGLDGSHRRSRRISSVVRQLEDFDTALLRDAAALSENGSGIAVSGEVLRLGMPLPPSDLPERFYLEKVEPMAISSSSVVVPESAATDVHWDPKTKQWKRYAGDIPVGAEGMLWGVQLAVVFECGRRNLSS